MGTGLFDSPSRSASRAGTPRDEAELYRALSGAAIAAGAVALVSPLVFFGWWLTTVPDSARALEGRDVLLKGYIYPGKQQQGLVQFLLVRDQGDCCFGGNPKITDRVLVQLADPAGTEFSPRLTKVAGRFRVQPAGTADLTGGVLYHLDNARVR